MSDFGRTLCALLSRGTRLLRHGFHHLFLLCCFLFLLASRDAQSDAANQQFRIFSEYGFGLQGGALLLESAISGKFDPMSAYGLNLNAEGFGSEHHQVVVQAGYYKPLYVRENGSEQIRVRAVHYMIDTSLGYTGRVRYFLFDFRMGFALAIVLSETQIYDLGTPEEVYGDSPFVVEEYEFPNKSLDDAREDVGLSYGFLINTGFGIDIGELVLKKARIVEFRIGAEYVRRGERNEIFITYACTFWPTALRQ